MYMQYEKCIFLVDYCDFVVDFAKYFVAGINFSTLVQYLQSLCLLNIFTEMFHLVKCNLTKLTTTSLAVKRFTSLAVKRFSSLVVKRFSSLAV